MEKLRLMETHLIHNGTILDEPLDICRAFNNHFLNSKHDIDNSITNNPFSYPSSSSSMFLHHTNATEVNQLINSLKNSYSSGVDEISSII